MDFQVDESFAATLDAQDPLASFRARFLHPTKPAAADGGATIYLCGNSLGLQPASVRDAMNAHLDDWATWGVEGHFHARDPWYPFHETVREPAARLVGALPREVAAMNTLTVNLHLLMVSFFRPRGERRKILMDWPCFPSDIYAVKSQLRVHGLDPDADILWLRQRKGEQTLRTEDILGTISRAGDTIAMTLLAGVNYATGQHYDMARITAAARDTGVVVGWDLAHAAGNVPLRLHEWGVDFAAWCTYKYLNSGPGAMSFVFVHERQLDRPDFAALPRFEGWWGNDPRTRFRMGADFEPVRSADAWGLSNPPIFAGVGVKESLRLFDEAGMDRLRAKSVRLTAYTEYMIGHAGGDRVRVITPSDPDQRGCQLSVVVSANAKEVHRSLVESGVVCDFREPDVIRVAPTPMYNSFRDVWRFARVLRRVLDSHS